MQIGAASTQRVAELLKDSSLLIVTSSRDELLVTMANLYHIPEYREQDRRPGHSRASSRLGDITQQILDRSNIPYLRTQSSTTAELYRLITEDVSKLTAEDTEKLELVRSLAENSFDFDELNRLFA